MCPGPSEVHLCSFTILDPRVSGPISSAAEPRNWYTLLVEETSLAACDEIRAFLVMAEDALHSPIAKNAQHIRSLPEPLQLQLATAINAITQDRYKRQEMQRAAELVSSLREFPGGLGEAIRAMTRVLIDNDAFDI
jgi:hypothetical protein